MAKIWKHLKTMQNVWFLFKDLEYVSAQKPVAFKFIF